MLKHFVMSLMVLGLVFGSTGLGNAVNIPINSVDGDWANTVGGQMVSILNDQAPDGRTATVSWGSQTARSSYVFLSTATPFNAISDGTPFSLGQFTHNNFPIPSGSGITSVQLIFSLGVTGLSPFGATFLFQHNETPNTGTPEQNRDIVTLTNPTLNQNFSYLGNQYFFNLIGFVPFGSTVPSTVFYTLESQANNAYLMGQITEVPVPEPITLVLLGLGLVGIAGLRRKK